MNQRITAGFLCLLLATAPMLGGCEKDRGTGAGYLFSYTLDANPQSLDPQLATDEASLTVIGNLFSGLFRMEDTGNVVPDVAESYEISPDGCTYTVHMRKDNYWYSLGDARQEATRTDSEDAAKHAAPVTAADFVYAFQRLFDPQTDSPYRERFAALKNGQRIMDGELDCTQIGVDASDTYTVVFTLDRPDANFLSLLATTAAMPCNPSFFYGCKGRYGLDEDSVISNGAFYLRMWFYDPYGKENQIYMRRNALNSRAKQVYPSNLTFYIQDAQKAEQNFRDSLTDCLLTADSSYAASGKYTTLSYESVTYGLIFNPRHSQYSNASLRKALSLGARSADYAPMLGADTTEAFALVPPAVRMLGKEYRELVSQQSVQPAGQDAAVLYTQALDELGIASLESAQILVPAGLTGHREGLFPLEPFDRAGAADVVARVQRAGDEAVQKHGRRIVFASDELYLQAGIALPDYEFYEDFPQLENGIGMIAMLEEEVHAALPDLVAPSRPRRVTAVTGEAVFPYLQRLVDE